MIPTRPRTVMLDRDSLGEGLDFGALENTADVTYHNETARAQVAERIADAEVVISNKVMLDAQAMAGAAALKLICVAATGTNNVDLAAASARGIPVCNVTAYGTASVAQHVLGLILALATRLLDYHQAVRDGRWHKARQFCLLDYPILELEGRVLGIVGHGELGGGVARRAEALGMRVLPGRAAGQHRKPGRTDPARPAPAAGGRAQPALPAERAHAQPDRRPRTAPDAAHRVADQCRARRHSR